MEVTHTATVACSSSKQLVSTKNNYYSGTVERTYNVKTFKLPFDLNRTYDQEIACPICGARLTFRVKTKGNIPEDVRQGEIEENRDNLRRNIIALVVMAAIIIVVGILTLLKITPQGGYFLIFVTFILPIPIYKIIKYAYYFKHPDKLITKFETENPYYISLYNTSEYLTNSEVFYKHRFLIENVETTGLTWQSIPTDKNL